MNHEARKIAAECCAAIERFCKTAGPRMTDEESRKQITDIVLKSTRLADLMADYSRLEFILNLVREKGTNGLHEFLWANPADNDPMEEDDVILDRAAIDKALAQLDERREAKPPTVTCKVCGKKTDQPFHTCARGKGERV